MCVCVCVCNGGECWDPRIRGGDRCRVERGAQEENASGSAKPSALSPPSKCPRSELDSPHHSIAISTLPAEFSKISPNCAPREHRPDCLVVISWRREDLWRALLSNAAIQVEPRERLRYEVEHHDFGGFRAGREVLHVRRYLDVHQYYRDFVQQVALGVRGLPLPDFPHAVAHVLLQHRWVPLRARLQGGSTRAPSPSPVALSSDP